MHTPQIQATLTTKPKFIVISLKIKKIKQDIFHLNSKKIIKTDPLLARIRTFKKNTKTMIYGLQNMELLVCRHNDVRHK